MLAGSVNAEHSDESIPQPRWPVVRVFTADFFQPQDSMRSPNNIDAYLSEVGANGVPKYYFSSSWISKNAYPSCSAGTNSCNRLIDNSGATSHIVTVLSVKLLLVDKMQTNAIENRKHWDFIPGCSGMIWYSSARKSWYLTYANCIRNLTVKIHIVSEVLNGDLTRDIKWRIICQKIQGNFNRNITRG